MYTAKITSRRVCTYSKAPRKQEKKELFFRCFLRHHFCKAVSTSFSPTTAVFNERTHNTSIPKVEEMKDTFTIDARTEARPRQRCERDTWCGHLFIFAGSFFSVSCLSRINPSVKLKAFIPCKESRKSRRVQGATTPEENRDEDLPY